MFLGKVVRKNVRPRWGRIAATWSYFYKHLNPSDSCGKILCYHLFYSYWILVF